MAQPPNMRSLRLDDHPDHDDDDDEPLFDSPDNVKTKPRGQRNTDHLFEENTPPSRPANARQGNQQDRDAALRKELESVRAINKVIEDVVQSLEAAKDNMDVSRPTSVYHIHALTY